MSVNTRGVLLPDPEIDAISALFYCLQSDNDNVEYNGRESGRQVGVIAVGKPCLERQLRSFGPLLEVVPTERDLLDLFVDKVKQGWDPEVFTGYEIHHSSWGYVVERAQSAYGNIILIAASRWSQTDLSAFSTGWLIQDEMGRIPKVRPKSAATAASDRWGFNQSTTLSFTGRHILPIWKIFKEDAKLQQYTFENVVFHVLQRRLADLS